MATRIPDAEDLGTYGCEENPVPYGCLECPLPACKYDGFRVRSQARRRQRDQPIVDAFAEGLNVAEVARMFGVSQRTVYRVQARSI